MSNSKKIELKNGEIIHLKKEINNCIKSSDELDDMDTKTHIMRVLIDKNKGLRCIDIAKVCKMGRTRIYQNLQTMIEDGIILTKKVKGNKYYFPQKSFWNNDIIYGLYKRLTPIIQEIYEDLETTNTTIKPKKIVLNIIQIALKLFSFELKKI